MRRAICLHMAAAVLAFASISLAQEARAPTTQPSAGVTGAYVLTLQGPQGDMEMVFDLKQQGDKITGTFSAFGADTQIKDGSISPTGEITFKVVREFGGQEMVTTYTCKLVDGNLKGKSQTVMSREFQAKRSAK